MSLDFTTKELSVITAQKSYGKEMLKERLNKFK